MRAKPRRTPGYRSAHRRPSRLRLLAQLGLLAVTPRVSRAMFG